MSDKGTITVVAVLVLVIAGVLISNVVCNECLFEFPEGGTIGGGGVVSSAPTEPATDEDGGGFPWLWIVIPIAALLALGGCRRSGKWPPWGPKEGVIKGKVTDEDTGENIEGVTVRFEREGGEFETPTVTGPDGYRRSLTAGTYKVTVSKTGWGNPDPRYETAVVKNNEEKEVNFTLERTGREEETGTIKGKALEKKSGDIIPNANIFLVKDILTYNVTADGDGKYEVTVPVGHWDGRAKKQGFTFVRSEPEDGIDLRSGSTEELNFILRKHGKGPKKDWWKTLVLPPEIMGELEKEIKDDRIHCGTGSGWKNEEKLEKIRERMELTPYPPYLLFKGFINTSKNPSGTALVPHFPNIYWNRFYRDFEGILEATLSSALEPHEVLAGKSFNVSKWFTKPIVEDYLEKWGEVGDIRDREFYSSKTKNLLDVFFKFGEEPRDEICNSVNDVRDMMGAGEMSAEAEDCVKEILETFENEADNLKDAHEHFISSAITILNKVKELKESGRVSASKKNDVIDLIDQVSTASSRETEIKTFEEFIKNVREKAFDLTEGNSELQEEVIRSIAVVVGPPLRDVIGAICILAFAKAYVSEKFYRSS